MKSAIFQRRGINIKRAFQNERKKLDWANSNSFKKIIPYVFASEAARCEIIIFPILKETYKKYASKLSFWIQKPLSYNDELTGIPEYMISKKSPLGKTVLEAPLLVVVEAKKNDFEQGWGQCLAELVAAQKLNKERIRSIYGIVTGGKHWEFGQLQDKLFMKNPKTFSIENLPDLFGGLDFIFQSAYQMLD